MRVWEKARLFIIRHHTGLLVWGFAVVLALTPLVMRNPYNLGILNLIGLYVIVVLGLNLFIGFAGQISLGHAAFFGLGAYGSAILTATYTFPAWPAMAVTAVVVAIMAFIIGVPTLRLTGHYLAMATLGFNYVVNSIFVEWDAVTGGPSGLSGVPPLSIAGLSFDSDVKFHYLVWTFALVALTLCLNLVRSGVGRGLAALAQDEVAASALGVDVRRNKISVFVLSAAFASVAGSLYAHYFGYVNPEGFSIFKSLDLVIMVVVGGLGSVWGTIFGAAFITVLPHFLGFLETYTDIIHGLILVVILLFCPRGSCPGWWISFGPVGLGDGWPWTDSRELKPMRICNAICQPLLVMVGFSRGCHRRRHNSRKIFSSGVKAAGWKTLGNLLVGAIIFGLIYVYIGKLKSVTQVLLFKLGVFWTVLTIAFECLFGRYVMGLSWESIWGDYNIFKGRLWPLVLIITLFGPLFAKRARDYFHARQSS